MREVAEARALAGQLAAHEKRAGELRREIEQGAAECHRLCKEWQAAQALIGTEAIPVLGLPSCQSPVERAAATAHHAWRLTEYGLGHLRRDLRREERALFGLEPARGEVGILAQADSEAATAFASREGDLQRRIQAAEGVVREGTGAAAAQAVADCRTLNAEWDALEDDKGAFVALARRRLLAAAAAEALTTLEAEARARVAATEARDVDDRPTGEDRFRPAGFDPDALHRCMAELSKAGLEERFGKDVGTRAFALVERRRAKGVYHEEQPATAGGGR